MNTEEFTKHHEAQKHLRRMLRVTPGNVKALVMGEVFVFGSNLLGRHGKFAAKTAMQWGAKNGQAEGLQGHTYGIPTVRRLHPFEPMTVREIKPYADRFTEFAFEHEELNFLVTAIGCGSAGHTPEDIAPLFAGVVDLDNVRLPASFWAVLNKM